MDTAIQQIREAAEQLAAGQSKHADAAGRLEAMVVELDLTLRGDGRPGRGQAGDGHDGLETAGVSAADGDRGRR
ncbi:MAG TPA: hypothetical protein VMU66_04440 [Gaiellales bacterium]|nr:hypothetical protein [Gaiellales bacterium]